MNNEEKKEISILYVNLKDHFDALWFERKEQLSLHFSMLRENLIKYEHTMDRRLEELNNLRREYTNDRTKDQSEYVKSGEYKGQIKEYDRWIADVNDKLTKLMTKYDARITLPVLIAAVALIMSVVSTVIILMK
jgi:lipopolysaccharide export LptBFGC system permease protein LptF